jgi:hypothetical protein
MPKRTPPQLAGPVSPELDNASRAAARFDDKRGWMTTIRIGDEVHIAVHQTEAMARSWIGLPGGSTNFDERPAEGNGLIVAKEAS